MFWAQSATGNVSERLSYEHFGSLKPETRVLECLNGPNWFWHQERRARRSFGQKGKIQAIWEWGCIGERRARRSFGQKCPKMPQKSPIFSTFGAFLAGHGGPAGIPNRGVFGGFGVTTQCTLPRRVRTVLSCPSSCPSNAEGHLQWLPGHVSEVPS